MIQFQWDLFQHIWAARILEEGCAVDPAPSIRLLPLRGGRCALLARPGVTVNGLPAGPLRMLDDRDEIRTPEGFFCFSAGTLPEIRPFAASEKEIRCPRCQDVMRDNEEAMLCPSCQAPYHPGCFSYHDANCASCGKEMELWIPEPLSRKGAA